MYTTFRRLGLALAICLLAVSAFAHNGTKHAATNRVKPPTLNTAGQIARAEMLKIFHDRIQFDATVIETHMPTSWHRIIVYDDGTNNYTYKTLEFYRGHD